MDAFELGTHEIAGGILRPLSPANAGSLGEALAAIPPWSTISWPASRLAGTLKNWPTGVRRFELVAQGELAGTISIQYPFLYGPYLQLLAILPGFQGRGLGFECLDWMEREARAAQARQLWLCVTSYNTRARVFYERFGFEEAALLDKLATDMSDEVFMRKRLRYP
jgi:ribosomal protein S18 acetylase RimI-like enzyme